MKFDFARRPCMIAGLCTIGLFLVCLSGEARAQGSPSDAPQDFAPPPLRYVPNDEQAQLAAARDRRARTRLALELADARLRRCEESTAAARHDEAVAQLGIYQALMEDTLRFLRGMGGTDNRARDLYRRLEQSLRAHSLRIEAVRRITPALHMTNVRNIIEFTQDARTSALNAFFGGAFAGDNSSTPLTNAPANAPNNVPRDNAPSSP